MTSRNVAVLLAAVLLLSNTVSHAAPPRGGLRYTIAVSKFENKSGKDELLGDEWATMLTAALHEDGHFIVVAQSDMELKAIEEQLRGISGKTVQGRKTATRGQMAPVQLVVKGVITHVQQGNAAQKGGIGVGRFHVNTGRRTTEVRATLQMVDTTTGAVVAARNFAGVSQGRALSVTGEQGSKNGGVEMGQDDDVQAAFGKAIAEVIPWMVAQLPSVAWRGTVVRVADGHVIINRGLREGVAAGDEFVAGESEILRDPDTGEFLDEVIHERVRIRADSMGERTSTCSVVSGDSRQLVVGMAIQYRNGRN